MKSRCRCCLTINSDTFYDIFEQQKTGTSSAEVISYLAEVQINQNDGLSHKICSDCNNEVKRIYEFTSKVRQADETLRKELQNTKIEIEHDDQMGNMQLLNSEYFAQVEDHGMQVCVVEEIMEHDNEQDVLMLEEIHEVEEINIIEEISVSEKDHNNKYCNRKDSLLEDLALVAATQENVNVDNESNKDYDFLPEDENDEEYLTEFDQNEVNNSNSQKWKCGECKLILRGDVSYEGHMNLHRQIRPHTCNLCNVKYRCRTALKRHKDLKHSFSSQNLDNTENSNLCPICQNSFHSEINFYLHQVIVHNQSGRCPFDCNEIYENNNLKHHLEDAHEKDIISAAETLTNDSTATSMFQCFRCSEIFKKQGLFQDHGKLCQTMNEDRLHDDDDSRSQNVIEIVKFGESEVFVKCDICKKSILKRNLNKHMEMHKHKTEEESNSLENTKSYLCAFCPREFKSSKSLHQHEKINHPENSDIVYVCADCERQYASQYLLETHRKQAHKERDNICNICGNAFKLRNQLMNHMKLHLEKNIPCPHCDKKYARQFDLNVHLRSHTGEQPYACHICDKKFAIKVRLTYHLQKHYGIKHCCKECGAQFNSKQKLKAHSFKHTGMPYRCQMCDYHGFATRNTFKRHLTRVHHTAISEEALNEMFKKNTGKSVNIKQVDEQHLFDTASDDDKRGETEVSRNMQVTLLGFDTMPLRVQSVIDSDRIKFLSDISFQDASEMEEHFSLGCCQTFETSCAECDVNFSNLELLKKHKIEAHKEKCDFICKVCGNIFSGRAQLSAHKRLHKERPFKCDQCNKAYPRKVELEIHKRTHTGELPYECHLCDKRFAIKVRLTYHLQKHEGITHSCTYCSAVYDSRNKLKAHLFKHTGMPYKCEFCPGLGFERRLRFANHMKRVHQKMLTDDELTQVFAKNTGKIVHFKNSSS